MPRKPTRSGNESRPTRRNLSRRVEDLDEDSGVADVPPATLVELLSYDVVPVDRDRGLYRIDGEFRRVVFGDSRSDLGDVMREALGKDPDAGGES